ncbi:MAG: ABC transporter ATP-binding protein/permease [Acetatifactor sp.]|nr:ABC transporter ATP-binding protein/permease [Acetatifactor sp.]
MIAMLKKLRVLLDARQKTIMAGIVVLMIISAVLQTAGIGLLVSVVNIVIDKNALETNSLVRFLYDYLNCDSYKQFSLIIMISLIVVYLAKNIFLFIQQKVTLSFVYSNQFRTSERLMKNYLRRNYEFYLSADTSVVQRSITSDVNNLYAFVLCILQLMSDGVVSVFVIVYCFWTNGVLTAILGAVLLVTMIIIKRVLKPLMYNAGKENQDYYSSLFKWISQTVLGIKEIKTGCREQYFVDQYIKNGNGYVSAVQRYALYGQVPKLFIEVVCVTTMVCYMIYMVATDTPTTDMLGALSTLAGAAFVLLPAVNRISNQINSVSFFEPFVMNVSANLQDEIKSDNVDMSYAYDGNDKLPIKEKISVKDITYAYPGTDKLIFEGASFEIPVGSSVGIVGTTGSGKSTVVDIILGLLKPSAGKIYADGIDVSTKYRPFLRNIGYIPQMIFMLDDTIRNNVAFGVAKDEIDEARVWEALREAQLDEFVKSLPEGLDTGIGERGIRLSGGQRQRIGIARALYHDPEVLILDEATSALDNDTEAAVMEAINRFQGKKTLLIIAHRLQTIEKCDRVYRVSDGKILVER